MAIAIASRVIHTALGKIRVELYAPEPLGADFQCGYRIEGPRTRKKSRAMGVDGFQALELAILKIGVDLRASPEFEAGPLQWLDRDDPGFPLPASIADLGWKRVP